MDQVSNSLGFAAIRAKVKYPELAREDSVDGTVIVQSYIDTKGQIKDTIILPGVPNSGLYETAIEAVRKTRFTPAMQRDRAVAVWISIPVKFILD